VAELEAALEYVNHYLVNAHWMDSKPALKVIDAALAQSPQPEGGDHA
jgi:hypothetical protein